MIKAHKIRLHPTPEQGNYFARAAGTSRFVWNWALAEWNRQYEAGEKPTALKLKKQFNEIRRSQFPWTWEVTKNASDQPFLDLGKAFTAFFEGRARRPKFKSKKKSKPSFYLANDQFELGDHRIWIPKLGWVNLAENLRLQGKVTGARITRQADWWFVSIQVEIPDPIPVKKPAAVGIDVGPNRLATLSTGEEVENQAFLKTASRSYTRPIDACIAENWDQRIGRKRADRSHVCIIVSRACARTSSRSSRAGWQTVTGSSGWKISTSRAFSRIAVSLARSPMPRWAPSGVCSRQTWRNVGDW
jgi:transposase